MIGSAKITAGELALLRRAHDAGTLSIDGQEADVARCLRERGFVRSVGAPGREIYVLTGQGVLAVARRATH